VFIIFFMILLNGVDVNDGSGNGWRGRESSNVDSAIFAAVCNW